MTHNSGFCTGDKVSAIIKDNEAEVCGEIVGVSFPDGKPNELKAIVKVDTSLYIVEFDKIKHITDSLPNQNTTTK